MSVLSLAKWKAGVRFGFLRFVVVVVVVAVSRGSHYVWFVGWCSTLSVFRLTFQLDLDEPIFFFVNILLASFHVGCTCMLYVYKHL